MEVTNSTDKLCNYCRSRDTNGLPKDFTLKGKAAQEIEKEILLFEMEQQNLSWEDVIQSTFTARFCLYKSPSTRIYTRYGREITIKFPWKNHSNTQ